MILKRIKIDTILGDATNCYIVEDEVTKETMVIDPGGQCDKVEEMVKTIEGHLKYIVLTHCHGDHTSATEQLKNNMGGKILIYITEEEGLNDVNVNMTEYMGFRNTNIQVDSRLNDGDLIHLGELEFQVIHTPGHTKGGICLYCKEYKMLFSGDTIFRRIWGRTDLPTGSFPDIIHSITNRLMILPEDTIIYPGHGKSTMVKEEEVIYLDLKANQY